MSKTRKQPKSPLDHIPVAVAYARDQAGLTQAQLGELVGVSQGHISEIERGTRNAPPPLIRRLAYALNCPRVILERKREPETTPPADGRVQPVRHAERPDGQNDLPTLRSGTVGGAQ